MKQLKLIFFLIITFLLTGSSVLFSQATPDSIIVKYKAAIKNHRKGINLMLKYGDKTPLTAEQVKTFTGLNYFPVNYKYLVKAKLVKEPVQRKLILQTTTDREPEYIKYGKVYFKLDSTELSLTVFRTPPEKQVTHDDSIRLFIPFKDGTSGKECYGGGRYIETEIPVEGDTVLLDFNKAYNPYCAYNHKYSCVIPPEENILKIRIEAGEKKFE